MTRTPLVTIGLPVYNSERYLEHSLGTLLGQTFCDFVVVISDNASTDGTAAICQRFAAADPRVRYHRNPVNIGNPRNFNRVFELTNTPYLKWSTSDDWWEPTFLERALEVMERQPDVALCYPRTWLVDGRNGTTRPYDDGLHLVQDDPAERFVALLERIGLAHQHLGLIRTECLRRTHLLATHVASDIVLLAELTLYGKYFELPERLFHRRFHDRSGSWLRGDRRHDVQWYLAAGQRSHDWRHWRGHLGLARAVARAPLPLSSKLRLARYLGRRARWDRNALLAEIVAFAKPARR